MLDLWMYLWSFVWFAGLAVFSGLSVLVIIRGGQDLVALLSALRARHREAQAAERAESGEGV